MTSDEGAYELSFQAKIMSKTTQKRYFDDEHVYACMPEIIILDNEVTNFPGSSYLACSAERA